MTDESNGLGLVGTWPHVCNCGLSYTEHEWYILKYLRPLTDESNICQLTDESNLEIRCCTCRRMMAREIEST